MLISGWGCAAGTLESLSYTRASSAEFFLSYTRVNSPNPPYPRVAVFQKLLRSPAQSSQNKTLYHNPTEASLDKIFNQLINKWPSDSHVSTEVMLHCMIFTLFPKN